jgi:Flp pilus assembly protein TadD
MLADSPAGTADSRPGRRRTRVRKRPAPSSVGARATVFRLTLGLVLAYSLRGGGSYDPVVFEQYGLIVWLLLGIGVSTGLLPRSRPSRWQLALLGALLAYTAWTALSLTWTSSSERTFEEVARCVDYLGLVAFVCAIVDRRTWRAAAAGLGVGAMLVCAIAVGSRLDPGLLGRDRIDAVFQIDRLSVPFGYWNAVAAWGAMCTAIGLGWSAHDSNRWRRAIALSFVPVAGLTIYLTYSRAGIAGAALAVGAVVVFSRSRFTAIAHAIVAAAGTALAIVAVRDSAQIAHSTGTKGAATVLGALLFAVATCAATALVTHATHMDAWRLPRSWVRPLAITASILVVAAATVFGPHLAARAWHSFERVPAVSDQSTTARLSSLSGTRYPVWKAAIMAFDQHPVGGLGAGTFEFWWNEHGTTSESLLDVHNIWLQNLAELGVPGLLLIVILMSCTVGLAFAVRRRVRRGASTGVVVAFMAAVVVYLLHASVDWMWESSAVTVLALAGVSTLSGRLGDRRRRIALPLRGGLAAAAAAAAIVQLPGIVATSDIRASQSAVRAGDAATALTDAANAIAAEPWSASAYEQQGLVLEAVGRLAEAAGDLRRAIAEEPLNYQHWLVLARIETESDDLDAAERDYDRAHQLAPRAEVFSLVSDSRGVGTAAR